MNILAFIDSYRKGRTIDTLVDKAIEGAASQEARVEKVHLIDKDIRYCKNCMTCREDDPARELGRCPIKDDMQELYPRIHEADGYIFATPVNMGAVTAVMKTFLERCCWTFAKPGRQLLLTGCPVPRTKRKKRAVVIVSSGIVPPWLRWWCDDATKLIKSVSTCSLNAKVVGHLYAGAVETRGVDRYLERAYRLGKRLAT